MKKIRLFALVGILLFSGIVGSLMDSVSTFFTYSSASMSTTASAVATAWFAGQPTIYGDIIVFVSDNMSDVDSHLVYYNVSSGVLYDTGIGGVVFGDPLHPSIYGNTIAFLRWFVNDGVGLYNISSGQMTTILTPDPIDTADLSAWNYAGWPVLSFYGNIIAFYDIDGLWYYDIATSTDWTWISSEIIFGVSVYGDVVAFSSGAVGFQTIKYYNVTEGTITDTGVPGLSPAVSGDIIAFHWGNTIMYYDILSGIITNTGAAGVGPSIYCGDIIAFTTNETWVGTDLNGDGDMVDDVIRYYSISDGSVTNSGELGGVSLIGPGGGSYAPPSIYGGTTIFITSEEALGLDVNNDGDLADWVVRFLTIQIPGDIDGDGYVGSADFSVLAGAYGSSAGDPNYDARADFDCDGYIGSADFSTLAGNYGKTI